MADVAPPPWTRAPQPGPQRRRDPLTQDAIVDAALKMLDTAGLDALSMRRVARSLGTTAGALYWHVGSKDGLLDLIFDRIIGEQPIPDADPERWQEQVKEVARTMRATILRHRDVVRLSIGRVPMGPNALRYSDRLLAVLLAGGLPPQLALSGQQLLISIVNGFAIDETGEGGHPPDQPPDATAARDYVAALPRDRFPHLAGLADQFALKDADQRFELLLDLFVTGLAQRAP